MQSTIRLFLGLSMMAAVVIVGCGKSKGPRETAEAFLTAMQHGDYETAENYSSEETAKNLSLIKTMSLGTSPNAADFTIKDVKEEGDYATVTYDQGEEKSKILQLRKDDGKWVVVMSKADMGGKKEDDTKDTAEDDEPKVAPAEKYKTYREGKTAEETAKAFMQALEFDDYDVAMRYGSESTNEMLDMQKSMAALDDDKKKAGAKTIVRVEEEGEFAKAYYKEEGKKGEKVLKLGKDDNGNWEVIMTKAEMEEDNG